MRVLLPLLSLLLITACAAQVGDECTDNLDCISSTGTGPQLTCDPLQPGGYCTLSPCEVNGCPGESVCIRFDDDSTFCMQSCESNGDCRSGYVCEKEFGAAPFCNATHYSSSLE